MSFATGLLRPANPFGTPDSTRTLVNSPDQRGTQDPSTLLESPPQPNGLLGTPSSINTLVNRSPEPKKSEDKPSLHPIDTFGTQTLVDSNHRSIFRPKDDKPRYSDEKPPSAGAEEPFVEAPPETLMDHLLHHVSFYRLHLTCFTLVPLIVSGVFYASNGRYRISYLDSLFLCYSSMTVTGLSTVNLSTLTPWQQVILFLLMILGDITTVSWIMVLIRKRFFRVHCEYTETLRKRKIKTPKGPKRSRSAFLRSIGRPTDARPGAAPVPSRDADATLTPSTAFRGPAQGLSIDTEGHHAFSGRKAMMTAVVEVEEPAEGDLSGMPLSASPTSEHIELPKEEHTVASPSPDPRFKVSRQTTAGFYGLNQGPTSAGALSSATDYGMLSAEPRSGGGASGLSVSFVENTKGPTEAHSHWGLRSPRSAMSGHNSLYSGGTLSPSALPQRRPTMLIRDDPSSPLRRRYKGNGGFAGPLDIINAITRRTAPNMHGNLTRKLTIQSTMELDHNKLSWLNIPGLVTERNSDFRIESLSDEQVEDLGGAEYRALRMLSYLVPLYFVGCQLISYILFAPWLSSISKYDQLFEDQPRYVPKPWFSLFQVMAAYTGGGLSLLDLGMVPFQEAYLMIIALMFCILAGNHMLPILLRFVIWIISKVSTKSSGFYKAAEFLLDHPRRCYTYMFPSHITWFLLLCLVCFSAIEWIGFTLLNLGLEAYEAIPSGPRALAGLFQGLAARASGFAIVPIASMAPALQFLYVVMMYIAIYPVAMSIRSTNVYEEKSLGIFEAPPDEEHEEPEDISKIPDRKERIGKYVGWHIRRQMSIDIWWLVWGLFLIIIIERKNLMDPDMKWFDVFRIVFELVSAFGGIGLTLGIPTENYSFVGAMKPLSKLVVIVIMVRGRHRGLPVAVDRAVKLPREMVTGPQRKQSMAEFRAEFRRPSMMSLRKPTVLVTPQEKSPTRTV